MNSTTIFKAGDSFVLTRDNNVFKKGSEVTLYEDKYCLQDGIKICVRFENKELRMRFIPFTALQYVAKTI